MRTANWETSAGALIAMLNSTAASQLYMADLVTITLQNGDVFRWTLAALDTVVNGLTFAKGPEIDRGQLSTKVGVEVDTLTLTFSGQFQVNGVPIVGFIALGGMDGARITLERVFAPSSTSAWVGSFLLFSGFAGSSDTNRYSATLTVNSQLELLTSQVPRNLYQASCTNTLYDGSCGLLKQNFTFEGMVTSSDRSTFNFSGINEPSAFFALGVITMLTGANEGQARSVKSHVNAGGGAGTISIVYPWAQAVQIGDTFNVYAGCDKTIDTCTNKFANRARFRGYPFIPIPDTTI